MLATAKHYLNYYTYEPRQWQNIYILIETSNFLNFWILTPIANWQTFATNLRKLTKNVNFEIMIQINYVTNFSPQKLKPLPQLKNIYIFSTYLWVAYSSFPIYVCKRLWMLLFFFITHKIIIASILKFGKFFSSSQPKTIISHELKFLQH